MKVRKLIDKAFNKLGYYRVEFPNGSEVSEADILEMFKTYGENKTFTRFLRDICARDIKLYFQAATDEERNQIRGAHARTNFFLALIKKSHERRTKDTRNKR